MARESLPAILMSTANSTWLTSLVLPAKVACDAVASAVGHMDLPFWCRYLRTGCTSPCKVCHASQMRSKSV